MISLKAIWPEETLLKRRSFNHPRSDRGGLIRVLVLFTHRIGDNDFDDKDHQHKNQYLSEINLKHCSKSLTIAFLIGRMPGKLKLFVKELLGKFQKIEYIKEGMAKILYINQTVHEYRAAVVENGRPIDFFMDRKVSKQGIPPVRAGNIYKGRVSRLRPGLGAAFVDIGCEKMAFLYLKQTPGTVLDGEKARHVIPDELSGHYGACCEDAPLKVGDRVLVEISREPVGSKGAKLTRNIKLAGRYIVYTPLSDFMGVSRRIEDEEERSRLEAILEDIRPPGQGVVARTFAVGVPEEDLRCEMDELIDTWRGVQEKYAKKRNVGPCYQEITFVQRMLREVVENGLDEIWVDTLECFEQVREWTKRNLPSLETKCKLHEVESGPLFDKFGIEEEWNFALSNKIYLRSGGVINIDQTEAMVSIDVNTGRYIGSKSFEETMLKANLEAVVEIARQLRLRNCGGLIVIDFIDMTVDEHKEKVYQSLMENLQRDRAKYNVMPISDLGLVEMTRKQIRDTLVRTVCAPCQYCEGSGWVKSIRSVCYELLRNLRVKLREREKSGRVWIYAHPDVVETLHDKEEFSCLDDMQHECGRPFEICSDKAYHIDDYDIVLKDQIVD